MMKKIFRLCIVVVFLCFFSWVAPKHLIYAMDYYDYVDLGITPIPCNQGSSCPLTQLHVPATSDPRDRFSTFYESQEYEDSFITREQSPEMCASKYGPTDSTDTDPDTFITNPRLRHFWAEDAEITALGKASERSRQFIFWAISRGSVDQAIPLKQIWSMNRNIALSFMILVSAVLGLAIALSARLRSGYKFSVQSAIMKVGLSVLYIALSATIVFTLVALSEIIMRFFIETLGGDRVFNTYFGSRSGELNYVDFVGCRDLNIRVNEGANTEIFLLKVSIITHYMMGIMLILRKILLWFLLLVSPFLPLLLSFPLIRNTGRIWIGVFFQWIFYGPLFALFFGTTAKLFFDGIPFIFDFSRIERAIGYVYPTAIIITYGGPAQRLNGLNNANYIDTFAEYIISLVLWWAATWFPWWLLRIFRDDCCDGIYAIKNAIYGYFDKPTKPSPSTPPPPNRPPKFDLPPPEPLQIRPDTKSRDTRDQKVPTVSLENFNMVRQAKTTDIIATLNLQATTLKDVAKLETSKTLITTAKQNFSMLSNPLTAQTATDRQKFLNLRTELFTRASTKNDTFAQYILSTTARSSQQYINRRNEIAKSMDSVVNTISNQRVNNLAQSVAQSTYGPVTTSTNVSVSDVNSVVNNQQTISSIVNKTKTEASSVKQILQAYAREGERSFNQIVDSIATVTQNTREKVREVLVETIQTITAEKINSMVNNVDVMNSLVEKTRTDSSVIKQVLQMYAQVAEQPFNQAVDTIASSMKASKLKIKEILKESLNVLNAERVIRTTNRVVNNIVENQTMLQSIASGAGSSVLTTKQVLVTYLQHLGSSFAEVVNRIADSTHVSREQIRAILQETYGIVSRAQTVQRIARVVTADRTHMNEMLRQLDTLATTSAKSVSTTHISDTEVARRSETQVAALKKIFEDTTVATYTRELLKRSTSDVQLINLIQETTGLSKKQVEETITQLSRAPSITDETTLTQLQRESGVSTEKVLQVVGNVVKRAQAVSTIAPLEKEILTQIDTYLTTAHISDTEVTRRSETQVAALKKIFEDATVATYTKELLKQSTSDVQLISLIQETTGLSKKQVEETITQLSRAPSITDETTLTQLQRESGVSTEKVLQIVKEAVKHSQVAKDVVAPLDEDQESVHMLTQQLETALNPETQVDQTIPLPEDEQSLEEYEEIRQLWIEQYRTGEVPLSEDVHNRMEWIEQDIAIITDILTKLISKDENERQQALDEVGFILPVFLMNNLSGKQLITYLKAKVSAAKEVRVELKKKEEETLVEESLEQVDRQTAPVELNTKHMEIDETGEARVVEENRENKTGEGMST